MTGDVLRRFNEPDAAGVRGPGIVLRAAPLALVRAPADAVVRYAGPFLDYGYVVVLEPEPATMVVLAGLAQLQVRTGAAVRRGDLLGLLGGRALDVEEYVMLPQAETGAGGSETLYIEVRHGRGRSTRSRCSLRRQRIGKRPMKKIWLAGIGGAVAGVVVEHPVRRADPRAGGRGGSVRSTSSSTCSATSSSASAPPTSRRSTRRS